MSIDSRDVTAVIADSGHVIGNGSMARPPEFIGGLMVWGGAPEATITGSVAEQLPAVVSLPAGLLRVGSSLRLRAYYTGAAGVAAKTVGYKVAGVQVASVSMFAAASTQARLDADFWVTAGGLLVHQTFLAPNTSANGAPAAKVPYVPGAALDVGVMMQLQNVADSMTLAAWRLEVCAQE